MPECARAQTLREGVGVQVFATHRRGFFAGCRAASCLRAGMLTVLFLVVFVLSGGQFGMQAHAHDELVGTQFQQDEDTGQITAIVFTYSANIIKVGTEVVLTDPRGANAAEGLPVADGPSVTQRLQTPLIKGLYRGAWRVVSSDGHPIEGAFYFTVDAAGERIGQQADTGQDETGTEVLPKIFWGLPPKSSGGTGSASSSAASGASGSELNAADAGAASSGSDGAAADDTVASAPSATAVTAIVVIAAVTMLGALGLGVMYVRRRRAQAGKQRQGKS